MNGLLIAAGEAGADRLCASLGAHRSPVEHLRGLFRGAEVEVSWERIFAPGLLSHARIVRVTSGEGLEIANLVAMPEPALAAPVLGVELVRVREGEALVVADLSPCVESPLHEPLPAAPQPEGFTPLRSLPAWFERWRSPHAIAGTVAWPQGAPSVRTCVLACVEGFVAQVQSAVPLAPGSEAERARVEAVWSAQRDWARDHRESDRGLRLLDTIVGPERARLFVREVMFPDPPARER